MCLIGGNPLQQFLKIAKIYAAQFICMGKEQWNMKTTHTIYTAHHLAQHTLFVPVIIYGARMEHKIPAHF
jgi:hypothetical protein